MDAMHTYTAVVERCTDTGLYVGYVPGFSGAHSQGKTPEVDAVAENTPKRKSQND